MPNPIDANADSQSRCQRNWQRLASLFSLRGINLGIGTSTATAAVQIRAGAAIPGGAPLKLTPGTNLTTPEDGTFEYDGTHLYFTIGSTRHTLI